MIYYAGNIDVSVKDVTEARVNYGGVRGANFEVSVSDLAFVLWPKTVR